VKTDILEFIRLATACRETCSQKPDLIYRINANIDNKTVKFTCPEFAVNNNFTFEYVECLEMPISSTRLLTITDNCFPHFPSLALHAVNKKRYHTEGLEIVLSYC
jgi:BarA-like signal transduction histidine kinase